LDEILSGYHERKRGLRQVDPLSLSLYLFVIALEVKKYRHFKTLEVSVFNTLGTHMQECPHCVGREKIFVYLKKFPLILNMFLMILIVVIYVDNIK
jgi:hypothetical protein